MRHLARCGTCQRQWEAGDLAPGECFRCACGALLTVPAVAQAHLHLRALHCATCGAARRDDKPACAFCGAAFRAEDLRRDTVCPGCFARIADDARFCDHCGLAIAPQAVAGDTPAGRLPCPVCGPDSQLRGRTLGTVRLDECRRCGGMWLETAVFDAVVSRARTETVPDLLGAPAAGPAAPRPGSAQQGPLYRPCPHCGGMMNRANYGRASGVVIDTCKAHGAWFDADELTRVLAWIRGGGFDRQREREAEQALARQRSQPAIPVLPLERPERGLAGGSIDLGDVLGTLAGAVARWWKG